MGVFDSTKRFKGQDYNRSKKIARDKGTLFVDREFPPNDTSISATPGKHGAIVWKRPKELCKNPRLFVGGVSRDDVKQGELGNCWFVAALSCLASVKQYWDKVIPDYKKQEWNDVKPDDYQGIFKFHFWRYGQWNEVVIDDMLPTRDNQLIFIRSKTGEEFWSALIEKAYAKLFGSYEALDGGRLTEALEDFTGGVSDSIDLVALNMVGDPVARSELYQRMEREMDRKTMMGASIPATSDSDMEAATPNGLVKGHAYGITAIQYITLKGSGLFSFFNREKIQMVRLRNPWGNKEWTGAFSDGSKEWAKITDSDRKKIGLTKDDDGEFWMSWEDFCNNFQRVDMCLLVNTSILSISKTWHEGVAHGTWHKPERAGGCSNHPSFLMNPQFAFDVSDDNEEFMVQLMQKSSRDEVNGAVNKTIGYNMLRVEMNRKHRLKSKDHYDVIKTKSFTNTRSILMSHSDVTSGRYVIIPSTFDPNEEGNFLLRVYTSSANHFMELEQPVPKKPWWNCCGKPPQLVTFVRVDKAEGLKQMDRSGAADPYCVIQCEGQKIKTRVVKNTTNPEWKDSAIFYRKKTHNPIVVQVFNNNFFRDEFMGQCVLDSKTDVTEKGKARTLFGRGKKEGDIQQPGKLFVTVIQSRNLYAV